MKQNSVLKWPCEGVQKGSKAKHLFKKSFGVTASQQWPLFFFDSTISGAWPWVRTPIRSEPNNQCWNVPSGQKQSMTRVLTFECWKFQRSRIACVVACCPSISMQTVQHCKGAAWLRHGCEVQPGCESRLSVRGVEHNIRLGGSRLV